MKMIDVKDGYKKCDMFDDTIIRSIMDDRCAKLSSLLFFLFSDNYTWTR